MLPGGCEHSIHGRLGGWVPMPCWYRPGHLSWKAGRARAAVGPGGASESLAEEGGALGARAGLARPLAGPGCSRPGRVAPAARSSRIPGRVDFIRASLRTRSHQRPRAIAACGCSWLPLLSSLGAGAAPMPA